MSEERDLVKKRGSFKGRFTAFVTFLDSLKDKVLSSCDVSELQLRVGKMESLYEQYDEVQLRLECIADDLKNTEQLYSEARTYREWEEFKGKIDKESSITLDMFMQFLRTRADLIENLERLRTNNKSQNTEQTLYSE
ncbi:hypothetical protein HF086_011424 [Spodoptera exigua]|uniref:Uncharacterized protein n=1 Tax=Spodoptera exigua TaxID=7107 RepID=A0A922MRJ7_SPOEX|nr:hypothetical protein HF086_011424 [Spodoptera exigua]